MRYMLRGILLLSIVIVSSSIAHAVSLSVGANLWYSWWDPAWREGNHEIFFNAPNSLPPPDRLFGYKQEDSYNVPMVSTFAYGPAMSIRFGRFSISSVFIYANYNFSYRGMTSGVIQVLPAVAPPSISLGYGETERHIDRGDSDTTLNYSLTPVVSLLFGFKFQYYNIDHTSFGLSSGIMKVDSSFYTTGPGLGIGLTFPLVHDFYMLWNNTLFFLWSRQDSLTTIMSSSSVVYFDDGKYLSLGGTSSLSLAYVLSPVNTTLALGFRYQVLWYMKMDNLSGYLNIDRSVDHYLAITFSAIYTFDFSNDD